MSSQPGWLEGSKARDFTWPGVCSVIRIAGSFQDTQWRQALLTPLKSQFPTPN